jgi:hypothetical protein
MKTRSVVVGSVIAVALCWVSVCQASAGVSPSVDIWMDRAEGSTYTMGERARIFVRPVDDCYLIVYEIDTDGYLRVLFPHDPFDEGYVAGGRIYRLGRDGSRQYYVTGPTGVAYIHVVASYKPFRRVYWHGCDGYENFTYDVTWSGFHDYWGCALPPRVYGDPYIAMQTIDEFICLDALTLGGVWADFTYFYVGERVRYPRYICYDCHGFHPHFRPYRDACIGFSISFVDCDPCYRPCSWWWWCSPRRVYCGPRYVCYSRKPGRGYPSQYKWKSRTEAYTQCADIHHTGNIVDATGVKSKKTSRDEYDLYTRREPRGAVKQKETRIRETGRERAERQSAKTEVRKQETRRPTEKTSQVRSLKRSSKTRTKDSKNLKSTKSRKSPTKSTNKRAAPKVRSSNKGRSPSTRRELSR